jgi:hypothetical protein
VWEDAAAEHPIGRALAMLRLAEPDASLEALATLPIGERDRRLLALRERLMGPRFDAEASCPACAERVEMAFTADQIAPRAAADPGPLQVTCGDLQITVRVPCSADLAAAIVSGRADGARAALLSRCVLSCTRGGDAQPIDALTAAAIEAIERRLSAADPFAELTLAVTCPACGHGWELAFDPAGYLWRELDRRAARVMGEVHVLARGYGWREHDILAMSETRRRVYLACLGEA